jgi:spore maturation protein CgeB
MVLNINRESMAGVGFSPPTRVFEAAGSGACLITDSWAGIEQFFELGREILVASTAEDIVRHLREISSERAASIGKAMRARALRDHTYSMRAQHVDDILRAANSAVQRAPASGVVTDNDLMENDLVDNDLVLEDQT